MKMLYRLATKRRVVVALCFALSLAVVAAIISIAHTLSALGEGYDKGGALICAFDTVNDYVQAVGKWPQSWHDLEGFEEANAVKRDIRAVKQYVAIDFSFSLDDVAKQEVAKFNAIKFKEGSFNDLPLDIDPRFRLYSKSS